MKKIYLSLLFTLLFSRVSAQEILNARWIYQDTTASQLIYESNFLRGESKEYKTTYKKNKFKGDSLISEQTIAENIGLIYVLDSTGEGYLLNYQVTKNLKQEQSIAKDVSDEIKENLNNKFTDKDLVIQYSTNKSGALERFTNKEKVTGVLDEIMEEVRKSKLSEVINLSKKEKAKIQELMEITATGSVLFTNLFGIVITNIHGLNGMLMAIDDTLAYTERNYVLNLKKPLDSDCLLYINSVDTTTNEVEYVVEKWMDTEALTELTHLLLKKQFSKSELNKMKIEGYVKTNYFIDPRRNWPSFIKITKEIYSSDNETGEVVTNQEVWLIDEEIPENP